MKTRNFLLLAVTLIISVFINYESECAEKRVIKGIVYDAETKEVVPFANIALKNKVKAASADKTGHFTMEIASKEDIRLVFSHLKYYKQEMLCRVKDLGNEIKVWLLPKQLKLNKVVVSASLYEQNLMRLTKSAAVISNREIADGMQSNMIDMLTMKPAFTQVWEYHSPILLRGMNSKRLIVMKNGNRRIGTFPGGYFAQDMNIYDSKKVEIIKGPGSVLYGSGAISGIINMITNDPLRGRPGNSFKFMSGYGSNNNELLEVFNYCSKHDKWGISLNGKYRDAGEYSYGGGELADNSNTEDIDFSLNLGYKFNKNNNIKLHSSYHGSDWGKPRGFNGTTKRFTKIRNEEERLHTGLNYSYTSAGVLKALKFNMYYDAGTRDYHKSKYSEISGKLSSKDLVHYKDNYGGGQLYGLFDLGRQNNLTVGVDAYKFILDNPVDLYDYYYNTKGREDGYKNAGQQDLGIFISDEWTVSKSFKFLAGLRYDIAEVNEGEFKDKTERKETRNAFSGNVGVVYSLSEDMHCSLNLGRAFRMPSSEELFTEVISCKGTKIGNLDLKPEYSWNIDLGFRGHALKDRFRWDLALFHNRLTDYINETAELENPDIDYTYKNTDGKIMGGEISASYCIPGVFKASNNLYLGLASSYVYGVDLDAGDDDKPLFGIPPFKLNLNMKYHALLDADWISGYYIKLAANYAGAQDRVPELLDGEESGPWGYETSESNVIFNASFGINSNSLPGFPKLRVIIKNLFDKKYRPFGSYIPAMGRNIKLMLSLSI